MEKTGAVKYVGLFMSKNIVKRGESVNAMVMLENTSDESVNHSVKLFIQGGDSKDWRLCSNKDYIISPSEHLHAYLIISHEFLMSNDTDEFFVFAGDAPPESDAQIRGVSEIVIIEG